MVALLNDSIKKKDSFATKTEGKYISGLDGLRGIAVIGVTLYHMFPYEVKGGFLGVSLFFVLSLQLPQRINGKMINLIYYVFIKIE